MKFHPTLSLPSSVYKEHSVTPFVESSGLSTITELADALKVPVKTIYYWVHRKQIPFIKMGRHLRFKQVDVVRAFEARMGGAEVPCLPDPRVIKDPRNRSLKIRNANPALTKE